MLGIERKIARRAEPAKTGPRPWRDWQGIGTSGGHGIEQDIALTQAEEGIAFLRHRDR